MSDSTLPVSLQLDSTNRAVSPVVGVVLMIVLAVSLTVVVGGFTSDLVDQARVDSPPHATLNMYNDGDGGGIRVAHDGGDDLDFGEVTVVVRRSNGREIDPSNLSVAGSGDELTPGGTFVVNSSEFTDGAEYQVLLVDDESGNVVDDGVVEYEA